MNKGGFLIKMTENIHEEKKSIKQAFVYDLIYPALLGAMIYDIVPIEPSVVYWTKLVIIIAYLADYFHLYFLLPTEVTSAQKDTAVYVGCDFLVSVALLISSKYSGTEPGASFVAFALVPVFFLAYGISLGYHIKFYGGLVAASIVSAVCWCKLITPETHETQSKYLLGYVTIFTFFYSGSVLLKYIKKSKDKNKNKIVTEVQSRVEAEVPSTMPAEH